MKSIGKSELLVILLVAMLYVYPLCRIAKRMGYAGIIGVLAFIPGINLILRTCSHSPIGPYSTNSNRSVVEADLRD